MLTRYTTISKKMNPKRFLLVIFGLVYLCVSFFPYKAEAFVLEEKVKITKGLAHYAMGQIYDLLGMTNWAILEYEKSSQFDDEGFRPHLRLGTNYARLGMLKEAEDELFLVTKNNPDELQSRYLLALIYSTQKEYNKAALEYEYILTKFSEEEPQNINIYSYLGQLYYSQRKYDQAVAQFEKILALDENNPDVMYLLGSLYMEINRYDKAEDILNKALEVNPLHDGSLNSLAYLYAEKGIHLDKAEALIKKALERDPENGAYLDTLGWIYYKKSLYKKSLDTFSNAMSFLTDPVIFDHMGDVYLKLNNTDEAIRHWQKSLSLVPNQLSIINKIEKVKSAQVSHQE